MNKIKAYFKKPSMSMLGFLILCLVMLCLDVAKEANNGAIAWVDIVCSALIVTIVIALLVQVARCSNEILSGK